MSDHRLIRTVMKTNVATVRRDTPFKAITVLLTSWGVSGAPVLDADDKVVGVVTQGDLLERKAKHGPFRSWRARRKATGATAADLMTTPAIIAREDMNVAEAARLMEERKVHRLPVVDAEGKLTGIVGRADLLRVFLRRDDEIRAEVRDEVILREMCVDPETLYVAVLDGVVSLSGELERRSMIPVVVALVRRVDGVVDVKQRLTFKMDDTHVDPMAPTNIGVLGAFRQQH
ncbi:CBS domain-containing protein [Amycolatopsis sp. NPDC059657]|uniref:CBS domain-containing protein n=1 Tax=Amycolatopsis sp. NPDC059657 TaxID=3346899 RepID=UPI00366D5CF6